MKHTTMARLFEKTVNVSLVGAGGNGSQMLTGLCRLHIALKELGHPGGLHVKVYDPDVVSEANIGRQLFSSADNGQYKSSVLVNRVNMFFGISWTATHDKYNAHVQDDIIITCVDSAAARRECVEDWDRYWTP